MDIFRLEASTAGSSLKAPSGYLPERWLLTQSHNQSSRRRRRHAIPFKTSVHNKPMMKLPTEPVHRKVHMPDERLEVRRCVDWPGWMMILIQRRFKRTASARRSMFLRPRRRHSRIHQAVVIVHRRFSMSPDPPCHDGKATQEDCSTDPDNDADDDALGFRAQARATGSTASAVEARCLGDDAGTHRYQGARGQNL